jgi:hypothetical protein
MSEREKYQIAKQYVDNQLKTINKSKQLSVKEYDTMVKKVASTIVCK